MNPHRCNKLSSGYPLRVQTYTPTRDAPSPIAAAERAIILPSSLSLPPFRIFKHLQNNWNPGTVVRYTCYRQMSSNGPLNPFNFPCSSANSNILLLSTKCKHRCTHAYANARLFVDKYAHSHPFFFFPSFLFYFFLSSLILSIYFPFIFADKSSLVTCSDPVLPCAARKKILHTYRLLVRIYL